MAGLAEDKPEDVDQQWGLRIRDNFRMKVANPAGCYCVRLVVDGEPLEVVVDDWFPFYIDNKGKEQFCFARNKRSSGSKKGEMWVQLLEKAWAKVCGSYEQAEGGTP